jgi:hypothetical protein
MFASILNNLIYIGYSLTGLYPTLQSMRDDVAFDGFEHLQRSSGGTELFLFNAGLQTLGMALLVAAYLLYSFYAFMIIVIVTILAYM